MRRPPLLMLYAGLMQAAAPLLRRHLKRRAGRQKEIPERLGERFGKASLPRPGGPLVWLHGASIGESVAAHTLASAIIDAFPASEILLTSGTVTSQKILESQMCARMRHQFLPLDHPGWVDAFFKHWQPDLAILIESEIWPNLLWKTRDTPLFLVNARMSKRSSDLWRWLPGSKTLFSGITCAMTQNAQDVAAIERLGVPRVIQTGNLKAAAEPLQADREELNLLKSELGGRPLWLAASTHPGEEALLADAHAAVCRGIPDALLVLVPRHPERGDSIASLLASQGVRLTRRSQGGSLQGAQVYLADTLGELGLWYRLAPVTCIGGSLIEGVGGHNPLEAAQLSTAIVGGPHIANWRADFTGLWQNGGALKVDNADELARAVQRLLGSVQERDALSAAARAHTEHAAAALERTMQPIRPALHTLMEAKG